LFRLGFAALLGLSPSPLSVSRVLGGREHRVLGFTLLLWGLSTGKIGDLIQRKARLASGLRVLFSTGHWKKPMKKSQAGRPSAWLPPRVCVCNILTVFFFFNSFMTIKEKNHAFLFYFIRIHYFNLIIDQQAEFEYQIKLHIFLYRFLV
jgi:hypothetical protein